MNNKIFAKTYESFLLPMEFLKLRELRKSIIPSLKGNILEIGAGTGLNLNYYRKDSKLTMVDINNEMLGIAKRKARILNIKADFFQMPAEKLAFRDNSFDTIVATLVLCSVEDQLKALKEMKRVCRRNGIIVLLEHVKSKNDSVAFGQKLLRPVFRKAACCDPCRDTVNSVKKAGLNIVSERDVWIKDVFKEIIIKNKKN